MAACLEECGEGKAYYYVVAVSLEGDVFDMPKSLENSQKENRFAEVWLNMAPLVIGLLVILVILVISLTIDNNEKAATLVDIIRDAHRSNKSILYYLDNAVSMVSKVEGVSYDVNMSYAIEEALDNLEEARGYAQYAVEEYERCYPSITVQTTVKQQERTPITSSLKTVPLMLALMFGWPLVIVILAILIFGRRKL